MTDKVTLANIGSFQNDTPAATAYNSNNALLTTAINNTLSRDGTAPNQMGATLDMNSKQIINLPAPSTVNSPARLIDVVSNPTIVIPGTGTSGHVVPFLDGNNTWSGTNTFSGSSNTFTNITLPANNVTNANLAQASTLTIKGNNTGGTANVTDLTVAQVNTMLGGVSLSTVNTWTANQLFKAGPFYDVKAYGAVGNNTADDTTAVQAAITAAQSAGGGIVFVPAGIYKITSTLNVTVGITILGTGPNSTTFAPATFFNLFNINTNNPVVFRDFQIQYQAVGATSGAVAIAVTASAENVGSRFYNLLIFQAYAGISFGKASYFVVDSCFIENFTSVGIAVANSNNVDSGDSTICNTNFLGNNVAAGLSGIIYVSSGGLRVENCKINQVATGINLAYNGVAVAASDLFVVGCSIEGSTMTNGIVIQRTSTGTWTNVIIIGNELEVMGTNGIGVNIVSDTIWLTNVIISNNIIYLSSGGAPLGVYVGTTSTTGLNAIGNVFQSQNAATQTYNIANNAVTGVVGLTTKSGTFTAATFGTGITQIAPAG